MGEGSQHFSAISFVISISMPFLGQQHDIRHVLCTVSNQYVGGHITCIVCKPILKVSMARIMHMRMTYAKSM